jgi:hypothetical protein
MNDPRATRRLTTASQDVAARIAASAGSVSKPVGAAGGAIPRQRGRRPACDRAALEALRRQLEAEPGLIVAEHRARLLARGWPVPSLTTVWRRLKDLRADAQKGAPSSRRARRSRWGSFEGTSVNPYSL